MTADFIEKIVDEWSGRINSPDDIQTLIDFFTAPAKTPEGKMRIEEVIRNEALPRLTENAIENLRYYWKNVDEHPEYYRSRAEEALQLILQNPDIEWNYRNLAESLGVSEKYAQNLLWLIRRAGFEV